MAQKSPPHSPLLERDSESSKSHPSTLPTQDDAEDTTKLLGDIIPSQEELVDTSTDGTKAPSTEFSEMDCENIPPVHSVMSQSSDDLSRSEYRRHTHDVQVDHFRNRRSEPHGQVSFHLGTPAVAQEVPCHLPRRAKAYHGIPKSHSKRFKHLMESKDKEGATDNKDDEDSKDTTVHIPGKDPQERKDTSVHTPGKDPEKQREETDGEGKTDSDKMETEDVRQEQSGDAREVKSGSKRQHQRSHRRKQRLLSDPPQGQRDAEQGAECSESKRKRSSLSSMAGDENVENLEQYTINQMLSHRFDDIAGARQPLTLTRSRSTSSRRSHKRHQANVESDQQKADIPDTSEETIEVTRGAVSLAKSEGVTYASEEDSEESGGPPSKFAALSDDDGKKRYNKEKNKRLADVEHGEEQTMKQVDEDVDDDSGEEEAANTSETSISQDNANNQEQTRMRKISDKSCESWIINTSSEEEVNSTDSQGPTDPHCRLKFSAIGQNDVDMVLAGRARYEKDNEQPRGRSHTLGETFRSSDESYGSRDTVPEMRRMSTEMMASSSALGFGVADMAMTFSHKAKLEETERERGGGGGSEGEKPKRRVTFSGAEDQPNKGFRNSESSPRKRRRGITWDAGVDYNKMGEMMNEIGEITDRSDSGPPGASWTKKGLINALQAKPLFVQLKELDRDDMGGRQSVILSKGASWKSKARWIKFEENWEEGADKWSKPHVASLTFNSLPQLRRALESGLIMLNVTETALPSIFNILVDGLVKMELIEPEHKGAIRRMLHLNGTGNKKSNVSDQWRALHRGGSAVRRLSVITDLARKKNMHEDMPSNSESLPAYTTQTNYSNNAVYSADEVHIPMSNSHDTISQNNNNSPSHRAVPREGILRKLPEDAEGAMVLVAMEDSLKSPVAALIRLVDPPVFDNFLEAAIPLRFIFFLVGPDYSNMDYHEVGRAMSTLFSDDIFRDMAYAAQDEQDLQNGINEFLNDTMVLPPGDWDKDLLLPITKHQKREQEKVKQRRMTLSPLQMEKDAAAILAKMAQEALNYADPLQRTGRLFGGLVNDVKRRLPHYKSDFTDAINFQCLAAFVFIYFACLSPAITFGGLLGKKTDNWMGVSEMIVSTSLCGMIFALFSGQPLVILGGTGPVLIFEEYLYKFCKEIDIDFMAFRTWIGFWICILATLVVMFEGSVLVRYFTRFTEEIFSTLISVIFIYETFKGLKHIGCANPLLPNYCFDEVHVTVIENVLNGSEWTSSATESAFYDDHHGPKTEEIHGVHEPTLDDPDHCNYGNMTHKDYGHHEDDHGCSPSSNPHPNTALFAIILTFGTFLIVFFLRILGHSPFLGRTARRALANFGIAIAIFAMVLLAYAVEHIYTDRIKITDGLFHPTDPCKRGWLINPMGQKKTLPIGAVFGAIIPAFLVFILLYMETLLIGMVVNKESNKLRKGSGYHLDLFLIGVLSALAGLMGVPWMCAAPIRTVSHIGSLTVLTRTQAPGVKPKLDHIKDQRGTNFAVSVLIGLSNLLAPLLREIPIAVLLGVFLYLGITSLSGLQFIERLKICFMPRKHHPDVRYIRMVKVWKMHSFTVIQVVSVMVLWGIKHSVIAMAFPFFLILLIFIRKLLKFFFSDEELEALDSEEEEEEDDLGYDYDL